MTAPDEPVADTADEHDYENQTCDGEDRAEPDSWSDPDIAGPWADPEVIA